MTVVGCGRDWTGTSWTCSRKRDGLWKPAPSPNRWFSPKKVSSLPSSFFASTSAPGQNTGTEQSWPRRQLKIGILESGAEPANELNKEKSDRAQPECSGVTTELGPGSSWSPETIRRVFNTLAAQVLRRHFGRVTPNHDFKRRFSGFGTHLRISFSHRLVHARKMRSSPFAASSEVAGVRMPLTIRSLPTRTGRTRPSR